MRTSWRSSSSFLGCETPHGFIAFSRSAGIFCHKIAASGCTADAARGDTGVHAHHPPCRGKAVASRREKHIGARILRRGRDATERYVRCCQGRKIDTADRSLGHAERLRASQVSFDWTRRHAVHANCRRELERELAYKTDDCVLARRVKWPSARRIETGIGNREDQ